MANQLGIRLHVKPGEELVADSLAHVLRAEMGAAAVLSGISARSWVAPYGLLDAAQPLALMIPDGGAYQVNTRLVVVENTHNFGGGTVQPLDQLEALRAGTRDRGVAMHLDGARIWNAHVTTGVPFEAYGALFDTVSVCLSKGLGAPVGSVLLGSAERMAEARIWRKRFGGGMRQVGILAAAGLHALDHHVERLADDHARAHRFAVAAAEAVPGSVDPGRVSTNIVVLDVAGSGWTPAGFSEAAAEKGIRLYPVSTTAVRLVWHLDVDDAGTDLAIRELVPMLQSGPDAA
jgi:threonine aldolase